MILYFIIKYLHMLGAVVILGTGMGIAFFMLMAHRSGDPAFIARTSATVVVADMLFTLSAVVLAEHDFALGRIIEAISHSKFWPQTAIFIVEDDAQNGADHVDAHRTLAFAISPYIKRHAVDSTMYSTSSMLRTIELILGLKPMSQFDAAATPMFAAFQATPDLTPYTGLPARIDLEQKNIRTAWGEKASRNMDFSKEDAVDDLLLNKVIWQSVRGENSPVPPPTRAAFVFVHDKAKVDDDD